MAHDHHCSDGNIGKSLQKAEELLKGC
ncbi:hypothetical protein [Xenorhabdus siamensis]